MAKKKKKIKYKNIVILIVIISIAGLLLFFKDNIKLVSKGYTFKESIKIKDLELTKRVLDKDYNKTFSTFLSADKMNTEYFDEYYKIEYLEDSDFISNVNSLLTNYKSDVINVLLKRDKELIKYVIDNDIKDIDKYMEYSFFKDSFIHRYVNSFKGDYKEAIVNVNIGLDKEDYSDPVMVDTYSTNLIVNKHNKLGDSFEPKEITLLDHCSTGDNYLSIDAKKAYDELCEASLKDNMKLGVTSSYRSTETQKSLYNYYLKNNGESYVKKYVSNPGFSEHETGLALDVKSLNSSIFANSKEFTWMKENAHKYGFILRYPEGKEKITGYNYESWHYRYVGKEISTIIYVEGITFEEYKAIYG